jgi:hypothetical protein
VQAAEPTNIIWENRHYDKIHYFWQGTKVLILVACLLAVSFATIYWFKSNAIAKSSKYPPIKPTDIINLYETPPNNYKDNSKMYLLYEHGLNEYQYLLKVEERGEKPFLNGLYPTFC